MLRKRDRDRPLSLEDLAGIHEGDCDEGAVLVELQVVTFGRGVIRGRLPGLSRPEVEDVALARGSGRPQSALSGVSASSARPDAVVSVRRSYADTQKRCASSTAR